MKRTCAIFMLLFTGALYVTPCWADPSARSFLAALESYKKGDYTTAIAGFNALAETGIQNGKLFYDLGNAYLKNHDLGRAIVWYEKALKLLPNDPDLKFNYQYARSLAKDAPEETASPLVRIFFFWDFQLSHRTVTLLGIALNLLVWLSAMAWRLTRRRGLRRLALIAALPALVFMLTAFQNYYAAAYSRSAIVLPVEVAVRSGLQKTSTELFKLHAGAKVQVVKSLNSHYQIRFSKEKIGWVSREDVGLI
jgi:tetratricopeptide (TPR) repeat protein